MGMPQVGLGAPPLAAHPVLVQCPGQDLQGTKGRGVTSAWGYLCLALLDLPLATGNAALSPIFLWASPRLALSQWRDFL